MYYVGQSVDIEERWQNHKSRLRKNNHTVRMLQDDFNKYGEDAFVFKVEKYIEPQFLNSIETHFMEFYDSVKNGYNINNTRVVIRKEEKEKAVALQTLKHLDDLEELSISINSEDAKIVLLNYFNMKLVETMYLDEEKELVTSTSLNHYINRSLTYDNSAILRYEVLFSKYVAKYIDNKYSGVDIIGCEVVLPDVRDTNYRGIYIGYINNLLMENKVKVGITYTSCIDDSNYYKELDLMLMDNKSDMLWNVKKGI